MATLKLTFLGTGTSMGVPTLGCPCAVCHSDDPADRRTRPSILLTYSEKNVVVDTSPDFRQQMLRERVDRVDAVLFTHGHADHTLGLDDLRAFNLRQGMIPLYADGATQEVLRKTFHYVFKDATPNSTIPLIELNDIGGTLDLFGLPIEPLPVLHGEMEILGFRFGSAAYVTDFSDIPKPSLERLRGLDVLVLSALRDHPHPNHSTVGNSLALVEDLKPAKAFFTHIAHDLPHEATNQRFPGNVRLAHDGLTVEVEV